MIQQIDALAPHRLPKAVEAVLEVAHEVDDDPAYGTVELRTLTKFEMLWDRGFALVPRREIIGARMALMALPFTWGMIAIHLLVKDNSPDVFVAMVVAAVLGGVMGAWLLGWVHPVCTCEDGHCDRDRRNPSISPGE